jgi:hypothetical protein
MTKNEFDAIFSAFLRRRPFRPFLIEFFSGTIIRIGHPEVLRDESGIFVLRLPDGVTTAFVAGSVSHLFDPATE